MDLRWEPLDVYTVGIWCLRWGTDELARVQALIDGRGWASIVARHRTDWKRHLRLAAPSERTARRWAERWTRANAERIQAEMPRMMITHCGTQTRAAGAIFRRSQASDSPRPDSGMAAPGG
jgi:hypothetical protein